MAGNPIRRILTTVIPGGTLFLILVLVSSLTELSDWVQLLFPLYPLAAVSVALLLGWRFDRSQLFFITAVIALAGGLLLTVGSRHDAVGRIATDAVLTLLPLNIALFSLLKERGIFTQHGLVRWAIIMVQPGIIWALVHYQQYYWLGIFDTPILPSAMHNFIPLEQPAFISFLLALAVTAYRGLFLLRPMEAALFWLVALIFYSQLVGHSHEVFSLFLGTGILVLIIAVIEITHTMAFRDELTGLAGRRALNLALAQLGNRYSIAMIDVDHFKKFNDTYGHNVGDEVLKMVASQLTRISGGGKPFRYGGEEFTVLFPGKHREVAIPYLEQLRESIACTPFIVRDTSRPRKKPETHKKGSTREVAITVSIGVAERTAEHTLPQEVLKAADKSLYRAKNAGRNRVA